MPPADWQLPTGQLGLARLLTQMDRDPGYAAAVLGRLPPRASGIQRIGITGSPGVGKSTLIGHLIRELTGHGMRVGVVAVDPSSPFSGGALLGDRLRWAASAELPGVFIRSLASRGSLGGVTPAASGTAAVLEAAGYQRIIIETVGVGQTGYDVVALADTVLALFSPESGDGIQLMKAGLLEIGDVFAVNKADRPGAETLQKELELAIALDRGHADGWVPPVIAAVASEGIGVQAVAAALEVHRAWLESLPAGHPRRLRRFANELDFLLRGSLEQAMQGGLAALRSELAEGCASSAITLPAALARLRQAVGRSWSPAD
jgi:LAO/AO transport system kinase